MIRERRGMTPTEEAVRQIRVGRVKLSQVVRHEVIQAVAAWVDERDRVKEKAS